MRSLQTAVLAPEPIESEEPVTALEPASPPRPSDQVSVGYLRAFITVLVLAHHAVLAYHPFAPKAPTSLVAEPRWWEAFPVTDSQRWGGFGLLVGFNDVFFMALMFFLSGLFVCASLERQGSGAFLRHRALRLGIPFIVVAAIVAPLSYYPAWLQTGGSGIAGFWQQWSGLGHWPAGPAWFIWVLLAFDAAAAGLYLLWPRWGHVLGRVSSGAGRRPILFFALLVAASAAAYLPMALAFNPFSWTSFGPFFFQTSRILHYLVYFLAGAAVGAYGLQRGLLAPDGALARRWPLWLTASWVAFIGIVGIMIMVSAPGKTVPRSLEITGDLLFAVSCAASSFAALAFFVRFARKSHPVLDSLRRNAFGMYLVHYAFASWLQYLFLKAPLSGFAKGSLVFLGTLLLSWAATAALRRLPAVARVI